MKKIFFVLIAGVFISACSTSSHIQNYRFAGETEQHSFNIVRDASGWTVEYKLFIDAKDVCTINAPLFGYENKTNCEWSGKRIDLEYFLNPGFLGIGRKETIKVFVNNERVTEFTF